ncbi:MAG: hypothetical protein ACPGJS_09855 [Flammeovirgaceae bacterium]
MKKVIFQKEYAKIVLDTNTSTLYEEWLGVINLSEFQLILSKKLALYTKYKDLHPKLQCVYNFRGLHIDQEDVHWFNQAYYPKLYPLGIQKLAFILSDDSFYQLSDKQLVAHMDSQNQIELCYFDSLEEGLSWIGNQELMSSAN